MRKITSEELKVIIDRHQHWIKEDVEDWTSMRANLSEADLSGADLFRANLSGADLFRANLSEANLFRANLSGANLSEANLFRANLSGANLFRANLREADLWKTDLREAKNIPYIPMVCPDSGSFIGWKKCLFTATDLKDNQYRKVIVKLLIPDDAKRSSSTGRKCRCSKAKILEFQDYDGNVLDVLEVRSRYQPDFIYKIGETIEINDFDEDRWNECSSGIHFFINRQEAVEYLI